MNIGFYDPISERWIKPRPEKPVEAIDPVSLGEALLNAIAADALKKRNDKIWEYLKQSAEGCNAPTSHPSVGGLPIDYSEPDQAGIDAANATCAKEFLSGEWITGNWTTLPIVTPVPPEYEAVESLGYIYWKPKD